MTYINKIKSEPMNKNKSVSSIQNLSPENAEEIDSPDPHISPKNSLSSEPTNILAESPQTYPIGVLEEFKLKYDQLRLQFQEKKKQADTLLIEKKKLEIEILNSNLEYYQKQISRLRSEVQNLQEENQENKHKYFVAENQKKDLEATSKVKQEQLKAALKQLEKEKILVVELKHQVNDKEKTYSKILKDMEISNQEISQRYDENNEKIGKLENAVKLKNVQNEQLSRDLTKSKKKMEEIIEEVQAEKQKLELALYKHKNQLEDLKDQIKEDQQKKIEIQKKFEDKIKTLQSQKRSEEYLLAKKVESAADFKNVRMREIETFTLEQKNKELLRAMADKDKNLKELEIKLKNVCSIDQYLEVEKKLTEALNKKAAIQRLYEVKVRNLEKEQERLKLDLIRSPAEDSKLKGDFQSLLKGQVEENSKIKKELSIKIDEIFNLRGELDEQKAKQTVVENEMEILKKKQKAEEKNMKIDFDIQMQNVKNEIESLKRKVETNEAKFEAKCKEVKDKDQFIRNTIIGRSRQEDVPFIVAELQRVFEADYANKLFEAHQRIKDLQNKI